MSHAHAPRSVALITGGAGFIGSNLAFELAHRGLSVMVFDNLSRAGVSINARWLRREHPDRIDLVRGETGDREAVREAVRCASVVFHCAAQASSSTSFKTPREDFESNLIGTLNVLEALRELPDPPALVHASTSKVYGRLADVPVMRIGARHLPIDGELIAHGVSESEPLDLRTPFGCSKGAADQYVLEYAKSYGIPAVVLRIGCVYGPHQFGTEEQGWVAHFLEQTVRDQPIVIYGDGHQVRDLLYVDDLVSALVLAAEQIGRTRGRAFNLGGGPAHALSLLEVVDRLEHICGHRPKLDFEVCRLGDRPYYVSDFRRFTEVTGWRPRIAPDDGIERLHRWVLNRSQAEEIDPRVREQKSEAFEGSKV